MQAKKRKEEMRDLARSKRFELTEEEILQKSSAIREKVLLSVKDCRCIMIYLSKEPEVETLRLSEELLAEGKTLIVPIIEKDTGTLRLSKLKSTSVLIRSTFGVLEPIGNEIPVGNEEIDAVIVPMLAFDRSGARLGYGAGYYDRFFSRPTNAEIIGLAYSCQEISSICCESFDKRMDLIITEDEVIRIK